LTDRWKNIIYRGGDYGRVKTRIMQHGI